MEELLLTTPETKPTNTRWRWNSLTLNRSAPSVTATFLEPTTGEQRTCSETGPAALALMSTLNTANLTNNSLQKRVFTWALSKNTFGPGTLSGTPD